MEADGFGFGVLFILLTHYGGEYPTHEGVFLLRGSLKQVALFVGQPIGRGPLADRSADASGS